MAENKYQPRLLTDNEFNDLVRKATEPKRHKVPQYLDFPEAELRTLVHRTTATLLATAASIPNPFVGTEGAKVDRAHWAIECTGGIYPILTYALWGEQVGIDGSNTRVACSEWREDQNWGPLSLVKPRHYSFPVNGPTDPIRTRESYIEARRNAASPTPADPQPEETEMTNDTPIAAPKLDTRLAFTAIPEDVPLDALDALFEWMSKNRVESLALHDDGLVVQQVRPLPDIPDIRWRIKG